MQKNKVIFKLNKSLDKKIALEFLEVIKGGIDFSRGITEVHPELRNLRVISSRVKKQETINKYFDSFYNKHKIYLTRKVKEFQKYWYRIEASFFSEAGKIFNKTSSKGREYTAYLSIINCNPRFLNNKSFQVFYLHPQGVKYVASHEILHFLFYDYAIERFPAMFKKQDTESGIFWDLSEIFNAVIQQTEPFIGLHGKVSDFVYPMHKKYLSQAKKSWHKYKDINQWIKLTYKYLMFGHRREARWG